MKDYEEKVLNIIYSAKNNIKTQLDKAYKSGYEDAKSELGKNAIDLAHAESDRAYQQGLEDAWEAAKNIILNSGLSLHKLMQIFNTSNFDKIMEENTASEAIAKIKEYEEKQNTEQEQDAEIKVGDEVRTKYGIKGIVITNVPSTMGDISVWLPTSTHVQLYPLKDLIWTGRHYDELSELFGRLRGERE